MSCVTGDCGQAFGAEIVAELVSLIANGIHVTALITEDVVVCGEVALPGKEVEMVGDGASCHTNKGGGQMSIQTLAGRVPGGAVFRVGRTHRVVASLGGEALFETVVELPCDIEGVGEPFCFTLG